MNRIVLLLSQILVLLGAISAVGSLAVAQEDTEMIIGGKAVPDGKFPWQVRLYGSADDAKGRCGGTIIAAQWVLTAAHCAVTDPDATSNITPVGSIVVGYGSVDRTQTKKVESDEIILHPDFLQHGIAGDADIALIKLKTPIADAKVIEISNADLDKKLLTPGAKVTVTGWGALWDPEDKHVMDMLSELTAGADLDERLIYPLKLHQADIQILDNDSCKKVMKLSDIKVVDSEICAMMPRSRKNSCYGDSGGPLLVATEHKQYVQVGVVSRGCGSKDLPNIYTRVSSFSDWLKQTMAAN